MRCTSLPMLTFFSCYNFPYQNKIESHSCGKWNSMGFPARIEIETFKSPPPNQQRNVSQSPGAARRCLPQICTFIQIHITHHNNFISLCSLACWFVFPCSMLVDHQWRGARRRQTAPEASRPVIIHFWWKFLLMINWNTGTVRAACARRPTASDSAFHGCVDKFEHQLVPYLLLLSRTHVVGSGKV